MADLLVNGYIEYTDPTTGLVMARDGGRIIGGVKTYVLDMVLTPLGFDGVESLDGGLTGDWMNVELITAT